MSLLGFTAIKDANMSDDPSVNPPAGDISSDKEDRMRDFFTRHGGPSGDPIRENENMINKDVLQSMKKGAVMVNVARGILINESDLLGAITHQDTFTEPD
jgi:hypothetical protein